MDPKTAATNRFFKECLLFDEKQATDFFEDCRVDVNAVSGDKDKEEDAKCNAIEELERFCIDNNKKFSQWRTEKFCSKFCFAMNLHIF